MSKVYFMVFVILLLHSGAATANDDFIGGLRNVTGTATVIRGDRTIAAKDGLHLLQGDFLRTGADSSMGIIFNDNSRISLGPESELTLTEFVFEPASDRFGFLAKIMKGTVSYISGKLGELSPKSVSFETPDSTIGTRGTSVLIEVAPPPSK